MLFYNVIRKYMYNKYDTEDAAKTTVEITNENDALKENRMQANEIIFYDTSKIPDHNTCNTPEKNNDDFQFVISKNHSLQMQNDQNKNIHSINAYSSALELLKMNNEKVQQNSKSEINYFSIDLGEASFERVII